MAPAKRVPPVSSGKVASISAYKREVDLLMEKILDQANNAYYTGGNAVSEYQQDYSDYQRKIKDYQAEITRSALDYQREMDRYSKELARSMAKGTIRPIKPIKPIAPMATVGKATRKRNPAPKPEPTKKEHKMSYTSREDYDEGTDDGNAVAGAVYVRDTVNLNVASTAAKWAHASSAKWAAVVGAEALSLSAMAALGTINPLFALVMIPVMILIFFPYLAMRNLLKSNRMIILETYSGYGSKWQAELHRGFNQLERLAAEARDPDAPDVIRQAFTEIEPVLWAQALKVAGLLNRLKQGGDKDLDSDTKRILRDKFVEFKKQVDKIDEIFKIVHSYGVLDLDLSTEIIQAEGLVYDLRNTLDARKELAAQSAIPDSDSSALSDSINELHGEVDTLDAIMESLENAMPSKRAEAVQATPEPRRATA